jgi:predicted MFS family arabinose efflux permease
MQLDPRGAPVQRSDVSAQLRLPSDPRLRRVLVAYGMSRFTEFAGWLAVLFVAYEVGGAGMVGVAAVAMQAPAILLVPVLAGYADRMPRSTALTLSYLGIVVGGVIVAALLYVHAPLWTVLVTGAVMTIAVFMVRPMHFASLPVLAESPRDLIAANGWSSFMDGIAIFVGFVLAGVITEAVGAWAVLALCALLSVVSVLLVRGVHVPVTVLADGDAPSEMRAALEGLGVLRRSAGAMALLLLMASTSVVLGSNEALAVAFTDEVLEQPESTAGLMAGGFGLGIALGGATITSVARRETLAPVVLAGALLLGLSELSVAFMGALAPVFIAMLLVGIGIALILVSARTLLQRTTDPDVLARVLAVQEGVHMIGLTVGYIIGPLVILAIGARYAFVPIGVLVLLVGLFSYRSIRSLDARAKVPEREIALLGAVPFLTGLPPYELERLARGAQWEDVRTGADVVRQGEPGNSYYLVDEGELSIAVDGEAQPNTLTHGDGFGEIALLHSVPRTATITALRDSTLLVVSAADFLGAVTSCPDGEEQAREIARARLAGRQA